MDLTAISRQIGEISGKLDGQDRMLDRCLEEAKQVRHDNATTKTALLLMNGRIEIMENKQAAIDSKVTGLNTQVTNIFSVAAIVKMVTHWGPVSGAGVITLALAKDWILHKLGFGTGQ